MENIFCGLEYHNKLLSDIISEYSFENKEKNPYYFICDSIYAVLAPFCNYITAKIDERATKYNISIGNVTRCFVKNTAKYVLNAKNIFLKKFSDDNETAMFSFLSGSEVKARDYLRTKEGYTEFLCDFPMAFKMLALCTENYINGAYAALENLALNIDKIKNKFDLPEKGNIGLSDILNSDFHFNFGVFLFDINGKKIVCKSRNINQFVFAEDFLKAVGNYTDLIPKYLCIDDFGYTSYEEEINPETKDGCVRLLINSGKILALSFVLSSSDMNEENIISSDGIMKLIDYETMITPYFDERIIKNEFQRLLLTGAFNTKYGFIYRILFNVYKMGIFTFEEIYSNICKGFSDFCADAIKNLPVLNSLLKSDKYNSLKIRILIRNTNVYDKLGACMYSSSVSDEEKYFQNISRLNNAFPSEKRSVSEAEIYSVKNGCVPIFECEMTSRNLFFGGKSICENFVLLSPIETVKINLEHLDNKSVENAKSAIKSLVHLILEKFGEEKISLNILSDKSKSTEDLLKYVYNDIKASAVISSDKTVYFLLYKNNEIIHIPNGLFLGNMGAAYFLSEYLMIFDDDDGKKLLYLILDNIANELRDGVIYDDLSFVSGIAGILYAFNSVCARHHIDKYDDVIFILTNKLLCTDCDGFDFYDGEAGILYVLSQLELKCEDYRRYIDRIDKLKDIHTENNGFAHGNLGIIYTLLIAYKKTSDEKYLEAAEENFKKINPKEFTDKNEIGLCKGITGYMLVDNAFSMLSSEYNNKISPNDYIAYVSKNFEEKNSSLCCGISGATFMISKLFLNRQIDDFTYKKFDIFRIFENTNIISVSLGYGKSGIGAAALKLLYPEKTNDFLF